MSIAAALVEDPDVLPGIPVHGHAISRLGLPTEKPGREFGREQAMVNLRILAAGIVAMVLGTGALGRYRSSGQTEATLELPGTVEVQEVRLGSKVGGRVDSVLVREGDLVQPGQLLVRFEAPELEAEREQWQARVQGMSAALEKARTGARPEEKEAAQAAVEAAQARYECLKAGSRGEEICQAEAELRREEATLAAAQHEVRRSSSLLARNASTTAEYDSTHAEYERSLARVNAARAHLDRLRAGSRKEELDEAAAELKRARANAVLLHKGNRPEDIAQAEAALAETRGALRKIEARLQEACVRATEPAVVEVLGLRKGDLLGPNQTIVRVLRADDLWIKAFVPETQLGRIRLGQDVQVTIDGAPDRRMAGTVVQIAGESEFTPRNVQSVDERRHQVFAVKVRVANPDGVFKSGMAATFILPLR
jgi:multidrug resistance efflux pump